MITIKDIATVAGVSHATVSFVLNGRAKERKISEAMSQRILTIATQMGYVRNEFARSVGTGKTHLIGGLLPETASEYCGRLLYGVSQAAAEQNYAIKLFYLPDTAENIVKQSSGLRLAGVISYDLSSKGLHAKLRDGLKKFDIPFCVAAGFSQVPDTIRVYSDFAGGCRIALETLQTLGHRDITLLSQESGFGGWSEHLRENVLEAARRLMLPVPRCCSSLTEFIHTPTSALFCVSDYVAINAIMKLREVRTIS